MEGRSLIEHERWLSDPKCMVLRIDGDVPLEDRIQRIIQVLPERHGVRTSQSN